MLTKVKLVLPSRKIDWGEIHWACAQNVTLDVIERLLHAYPDSVDVRDECVYPSLWKEQG